jgi:hypothetical protein
MSALDTPERHISENKTWQFSGLQGTSCEVFRTKDAARAYKVAPVTALSGQKNQFSKWVRSRAYSRQVNTGGDQN